MDVVNPCLMSGYTVLLEIVPHGGLPGLSWGFVLVKLTNG